MGIDVTMDMGTGRLRCNDCEKLRAEVELATMRVGSLTAEVEAQRQQISELVAEVERLKLEAQEAEERIRLLRGDNTAAEQELREKDQRLDELRAEADDARRAALEETAGIVEQAALHERLKPRRNEVVEIAAAIRAAAKEEKR